VARRDGTGPLLLFRTVAASRHAPTGELEAAALDRGAASEARAAANEQRPADMAVANGAITTLHSQFPMQEIACMYVGR